MLDAAVMENIPHALCGDFDAAVADRQVQVLRTAYRVLGNWADAEDVAQEVFIRLHRNGLKFPSTAALSSWLYRVTVNLCLDRIRSARLWNGLSEMPSRSASAEAVAIRDEQRKQLMAALGKLPAKERAAIVLREIEGLSTAEVAEALGSTETTVRSQVSKAMGRLRMLLTEGAV